MLADMPRHVWLEWQAYFRCEPWGEERADLRAAIVAHTVHGHLRSRGSRALRVSDFMAVREPPPPAGAAEVKMFISWLRGGGKHAKASQSAR